MDTLTFIAEMTKPLAWPLAIVTIALVFRPQIRALLSRIKRGKFGPAEFVFEEEIKELAEERSLLANQNPSQPPLAPVETASVSLAAANPRAAILEAWIGVEASVNQLVKTTTLPKFVHPRDFSGVVRALARNGVIAAEDISLINEIRALRNQAAHDQEFTPSSDAAIN